MAERDEETLKQMEEIQSTVETSQPLIGPSVSVERLLSYYQDNELPGFLDGIRYLSSKYPRMRSVRGDGNCFYRSLLFSYLEEIVIGLRCPEPLCVTARDEYKRFYDTILKSKEELIAIGYDEFTFEFFFDSLVELLDNLPSNSPQLLYDHFVNDGSADVYTWYMRLLTAGHLKKHADRYFPFVDMGEYYYATMDAFCQREVEPMGKECEHLQVSALTEYLQIRVKIEYLDGRPGDEGSDPVRSIQFPAVETSDEPPKSSIETFLLYRPGHYDILYQSQAELE